MCLSNPFSPAFNATCLAVAVGQPVECFQVREKWVRLFPVSVSITPVCGDEAELHRDKHTVLEMLQNKLWLLSAEFGFFAPSFRFTYIIFRIFKTTREPNSFSLTPYCSCLTVNEQGKELCYGNSCTDERWFKVRLHKYVFTRNPWHGSMENSRGFMAK